MKIRPVAWGHVERYSQVVSEYDGTLCTIVHVDRRACPYQVVALRPDGQLVVRSVEPWSNAHVVEPEFGDALVIIAQHFHIEGMETING